MDDARQPMRAMGLHLDADPGDARGFQLEDAGGLPLPQHGEGLGVVVPDGLHGEGGLDAADLLLGVVDDRQVAEPQEVHLQKAQLLDGGHGELGDDGVLVPGQGDVVRNGPRRDDYAGGVSGGVAGHALDIPGGIDQPLDLGDDRP